MLTEKECQVLRDRAMFILTNQNERTNEDDVNDMMGLYFRFKGGRDDIAAGYKAKLDAALAEWRATRGW